MDARTCTIATEAPDLPRRVFDETYRDHDVPVVIRNATSALTGSCDFRAMTTVAALAAAFGDAVVTLSSANAFSYGRRRARVADYLASIADSSARETWGRGDTKADDVYYWFGEHGDELRPLLKRYPLPRYTYAAPSLARFEVSSRGAVPEAARSPALSFGVAPDGSGVPFHFHNDGFSEVMHGAKRWLLYQHKPPRFRENATSVSWLREDYPQLSAAERPRECTIRPGDLLYFPKGWWHAIINVGETVFMSTFL